MLEIRTRATKVIKYEDEVLLMGEISVDMVSTLLHSHCETCIKQFCSLSPDGITSCPMVLCEQACGARFHGCKKDGHAFICQLERVPCINKVYGCPFILLRAKIKSHLRVCPASVVRCGIEWNRWPMHSLEERKKAPLPLNNPHVKCGQLDVALAFRDQRMLLDSMKVSKRTRRILQNSLTRRYPAVPFGVRSSSIDSDTVNSEDTSKNVSDEESDAPWEVVNSPPGLQSSICSKLHKASKDTATHLSAALDLVSNHMGLEAIRHMKLDYISEADETSKSTCDILSEKKEHKKSTETRDALSQNIENTCDTETRPSALSSSVSNSQFDLAEKSGTVPLVSSTTFNETSSLKSEPDVEVYNQSSKLHDLLGVDINIECISKYQQKPSTMYTFLCAQEFRRDEYSWHLKNVHNEIQCALNGWLEQRCPLAWQGCTWSFHRFSPNDQNSSVVYNPLSESLGLIVNGTEGQEDSETSSDQQNTEILTDAYLRKLRQATPEIYTSYKYDSDIKVLPNFKSPSQDTGNSMASKSGNTLELNDLPFEMLQHVARRLNGFDLANLSLTCHFLRDVCCSLLEEMGIVVLVWEKRPAGHTPRWRVSYKKWQFSNSFTPIRSWIFNGFNPVSQHLKECSYNQDKNRRTDRVRLMEMGQSENNLHVLDKLDKDF
ncbi:hypothetical protein ScPMuIL_015886 [Solemya velum]